MRRHTAFTIAVAGILLLSGCLGATPTDGDANAQPTTDSPTDTPEADDGTTADGPDGADILRRSEQSLSTVQSLTATINQTFVRDGQVADNATLSLAERDHKLMQRTEVLGDSDWQPHVVAINESHISVYDAAAGTVSIHENPNSDQPGLAMEWKVRTTNRSATPTFLGNATVDGQQAYRVKLTPESDGRPVRYFWLGHDDGLLLKERAVYNDSYQFVRTYRNLQTGVDIPDERFTFTPPADATVEDTTGESSDDEAPTHYPNESALADATSIELPDPTVVSGYSFQHGTVVDGEAGHGVHTVYADGKETYLVAKFVTANWSLADVPGNHSVTVDGHDAVYNASTGGLQFECEGVRYVVDSDSLTRAELFTVAESIACN